MTSCLQKYVIFFTICMVAVLAGIVGITIGQSIAGHTPDPFSIVLRIALFAFGLSALAGCGAFELMPLDVLGGSGVDDQGCRAWRIFHLFGPRQLLFAPCITTSSKLTAE
jgi:hypothetical protein